MFAFLREIKDYLRIKRGQANKAIMLIERYFFVKKDITAEEFVRLCKFAENLNKLNDQRKQKKENKVAATSVKVEEELKEQRLL